MGNDHSQMSGMQVEEKAVEVTDFWTHHTANVNSGSTNAKVSVFIGEPLVGGSLWISQTPLEKASKNLMLHRHPCILKYISSWNKSSKYYLAVEDVSPLSHSLAAQSTLQICVGLHSVLKALVFLHENAQASHNNVCTASVYVTKDGNWKLGGLEYLCKFGDLGAEYLGRTRGNRYKKAVDPNEDKNVAGAERRVDSVDGYAFGVLVGEVFTKKTDTLIPSLSNFLDVCKNGLQNANVKERPKLKDLLEHPFFNHDFILMHSFLTELPLKSDGEKDAFFASAANNLRKFDEGTIAEQLGGLLLSRMVLLNGTAQTDLIPHILKPKDDVGESESIFTVETFKKFMVPKLLDIFCVRDAQIRLLLLEYFNHYISCFSKQELQSHVLPELLVGIKDTNDHLVAVTLRALSDLIPILGAATVIGGKRARLFNDGRPNAVPHTENKPPVRPSRRNSRRNEQEPPSVETIMDSVLVNNLELPERPSPDGEEENEVETEVVHEESEPVEEEAEVWDDWDINEEVTINREYIPEEIPVVQVVENTTVRKKSMPDIFELDIKNQKNASGEKDEFDFFQDMEPVIETSSKFVVDNEGETSSKLKLDLSVDSSAMEDNVEGWGEDLDWGE